MLEFAREQWLWLFLLVAAFYVAWWFARRYRKRTVTYGRIWERVAKRMLPPGWKRVLRTVLTLLIAGVMLSAIVLRAAGLQRPEAEQPPPKLVVIVLDNSPSMRAVHDGKTRAQMAQDRAQQIVDALGENDRAIIAYNKEGTALLGRWLKRGETLGEAPPTDFAFSDYTAELAAAINALTPPPDLPAEPPPQKLAFVLTDDPTPDLPPMFAEVEGLKELLGVTGRIEELLGVPTAVETFGAAAVNHALYKVSYEPPAPEDGTGGKLTAMAFEYGEVWRAGHARVSVNGAELTVDGNEYVLPASSEPQIVRVFTGHTDPLPHDDEVSMQLNPQALQRVAICRPEGDDTAYQLLRATLSNMLPGREFFTCGPGADVQTDLLVCDRALPASFQARYLLCFGVVPPEFGAASEPVEARSGLRLATPAPRGLGFELPDLSLVWSLEAVPLAPGHKLDALVRNLSGETLLAVKRSEPEVLYSGFIPSQSTLIEDRNGLLLLLRWLTAIQSGSRLLFPPFVRGDAETEFQLDQPAKLRVKLAHSPWLPAHGPREFEVATGADGRGKLGPFTIPGEYAVMRDGTEIGRFTAIWISPIMQSLHYEARQPTDLHALFEQNYETDWRDHLPGMLLWIALGLLVFEWALWLIGATE